MATGRPGSGSAGPAVRGLAPAQRAPAGAARAPACLLAVPALLPGLGCAPRFVWGRAAMAGAHGLPGSRGRRAPAERNPAPSDRARRPCPSRHGRCKRRDGASCAPARRLRSATERRGRGVCAGSAAGGVQRSALLQRAEWSVAGRAGAQKGGGSPPLLRCESCEGGARRVTVPLLHRRAACVARCLPFCLQELVQDCGCEVRNLPVQASAAAAARAMQRCAACPAPEATAHPARGCIASAAMSERRWCAKRDGLRACATRSDCAPALRAVSW